jgi:Helix-turn-helix domain
MSSVTLETLRQCRPLRPSGSAGDFEADRIAVLRELRDAGPRGVSTLEFLRRGIGGLRVANRIYDLRKQGHLIQTVRESGRQCRFVLRHENPSPTPKPASVSDFMRRRREEDEQEMPLFTVRP